MEMLVARQNHSERTVTQRNLPATVVPATVVVSAMEGINMKENDLHWVPEIKSCRKRS